MIAFSRIKHFPMTIKFNLADRISGYDLVDEI